MTKTDPKNNGGKFDPAVPIDAIEASKTNPRKFFDKGDLEELARSIREKGVIQPIVLRPHPKATKSLLFEIVAGERRYRATKLAEILTIPSIIRDLDDTAVLEIQVIENLQRSDVHELEEAHGYRRLIKEAKYEVKDLALRVGKSEEYIYARMKLLALDKDLQDMFLKNEITAGHAVLLARLPKESQMLAARQLYQQKWNDVAGGQTKDLISVRDLGYFIQRQIQMDLGKAPFDVEDLTLVKAAGACSACPKRTGASVQLFPEVKGHDLCLDRGCYVKKLAAFVEQQVQENGAVRITDKYQSTPVKGVYYSGYTREVKASSCKNTVDGIHIDGHLMGKIVTVCVKDDCKVHSSRGGGGGSQRSLSTPQQRFETTKSNIDQKVRDEVRDQIYKAAVSKLLLLGSDMGKITKRAALTMVLRMVYNRIDSTARAGITEELELPKAQYSKGADVASVLKYAAKLDLGRLQGLIVRVALRDLSLGFGGMWSSGTSNVDRELEEIAGDYGVKVDAIRKQAAELKAEKLKKAKDRLMAAIEKGKTKPVKKGKPQPVKTGKAQTSAKKPPIDTDEEEDD